MIGSYAQLNTYCYPFKEGTQFKIESEDDGMWSLNDFFRGPTSNGKIITCSWGECDLIEDSQYTGAVFEDDWMSEYPQEKEEYWEYTNYP
jgi:hypothetical protein